MRSDHKPYWRVTSKSRLDKSINSLLGVVEGITIDREINAAELAFLNLWLDEHRELQSLHPFNELIPVVQGAFADGMLTEEEKADIVWLCERLCSTKFYDGVTADLQRLHAIVGGIAADAVVSQDELRGLAQWMEEHRHLRRCWPYDEIESLVTGVLADQKIDQQEHAALKDFFGEFVEVLDKRTLVAPEIVTTGTLVGLCAVCPELEFEGSKFCFKGASARYSRKEMADAVLGLGGVVVSAVSAKVNYLVIGADGNPCWTYACYGRKVEKAVQLRKEGAQILLVHENDFHDAVQDLS